MFFSSITISVIVTVSIMNKTTISMISQRKLFVYFIIVITLPATISCYYNETKFKELVLHDTSNDDAVDMTTEELINRSGYKYEEYYAVADDGYITQILRVINPKADKAQLKHPPVLMLHGSHLDTSIYVMSSSIQHHPEPWPRKESDGPMTSSNRSLAFTLANNGYDVWLLGSRGSNDRCSAYTTKPKFYQAQQPHFKPDASMHAYSYTPNYWQYGLDDVIQYELRNQIDLVRNITGTMEFSYFSFSLSTITTMAFLAENPNYAQYVRVYTQMAPVIAANHFTHLGKLYWEKLMPHLPTRGIGFFPSYFLDDFFLKQFVLKASRFARLRYSLLYLMNRVLFGPSPRYNTNMERNVMAHLIQPVSFKSAQQYGQSSVAQKFNKFDYGRLGNLLHYNKTTPPEHKVDRLEVDYYLIIAGSLDNLADPVTVQRLVETTSTKRPISQIIAPGYNHIDVLVGVENDRYVNLPFVQFLDAHQTPKLMKLIKPQAGAVAVAAAAAS